MRRLSDHSWAKSACRRALISAVIAKAMTAEFEEGDVIVLAQASMAGAALLVSNCPIPILSSPKMGVDRAIEALI